MSGAQAIGAQSSARAWLAACRPATLGVSLAPVLVGAAVAKARGGLDLSLSMLALFAAVAIQIGTNLSNDLFDADKGADGPDRLGPRRAVASGLLTRQAVAAAAIAAFAVAVAAGAFLVWHGGWTILLIGLCSIAAGVAYTAGPYALAYLGLGDVFVFVFFGPVAVAGTSFLSLHRFDAWALAASVPIGALASAVLVVNNLRDRVGDARVGKRTLVARLGAGFGRLEYGGLLLLAYAVPLLFYALTGAGARVLLPFLSLPLALYLLRAIVREDGRALNPRLGQSAALLMAFALLLALGIGS